MSSTYRTYNNGFQLNCTVESNSSKYNSDKELEKESPRGTPLYSSENIKDFIVSILESFSIEDLTILLYKICLLIDGKSFLYPSLSF